MNLRIYRVSTTGNFGYAAYAGGRKVFASGCSTVSRHPEVWINCENGQYRFESTMDPEVTLIPGTTARRICNQSGTAAAILRLEDRGYTLLTPGQAFSVEDRDGKILAFSDRGEAVLQLKRLDRSTPVEEAVRRQNPYFDLEPWFDLSARQDLPLPTIAILATFPLLRFDKQLR